MKATDETPDSSWPWIRTYIDLRFHGIEQLHAEERTADRKALDVAKAEMNRRLEDMNQFRAQIQEERGTFLPREYYNAQHTDLQNKVDRQKDVLEARLSEARDQTILDTGKLEERIRLLENKSADFSGRLWAFGVVASLIGVIVSFALKFITFAR